MKIYDLFCYNGEADILEIRLNILDPYVDFSVLGESEQTFSKRRKSLYYAEQKERFAKWKDKIIYVKIPNFLARDSFHMASLQKDYLRTALKDCQPDDIIYYGDCDEIWTPQKEEGKLRQLNYSYYLNNRSSEDWQGTNMVKYGNIKDLNELRADHSIVLENGGWHFTNMGGADEIRRKLDNYDHQEMNTEENRRLIEQRMENGEDYAGRNVDWQGKPFMFWTSEVDLPQYLLYNKDKYKHLWK